MCKDRTVHFSLPSEFRLWKPTEEAPNSDRKGQGKLGGGRKKVEKVWEGRGK